jgi:hypothetical protein
VDKLSLLEVVKNSSAKSAEEAQNLLALRSQFPFSQLLQVLSAKVSKEHQLPTQEKELQRAAVYTSDRHLLKEIMTTSFSHQHKIAEIPVVSEEIHPTVVDAKPETSFNVATTSSQAETEKAIAGFDLADTIMKDLQKLHESKHNFEMLFADYSSVSMPVTPLPVVPVTKTSVDVSEKTDASDSGKSKREKIIELARSVGSNTDSQPSVLPRKKRKEPQDAIIEEIKTSKEEIELETERQKEQIQIIDHFIKLQPSISNPRDKNLLPVIDLNAIKSGEFSENIVSETLVEILIKQGKKDRAIEVLKKLIWKYPQKKAYFASQIEDLKK